MAVEEIQETQLGDLPDSCLSYAISLTSPHDACRCAAVSHAFRAAANSDDVWQKFIPIDHWDSINILQQKVTAAGKTRTRMKDAYFGLCNGGGISVGGDGGCRVWLEKASGAKCYALSARSLSLPWDDGEYSWRWTPHSSSRFAEVAELMDCTCLEIFGRLPAAVLTPATSYAAYLVYGMAEGHRGLSYPDQETVVSVGGSVLKRHRVCLQPDDTEMRKFRGVDIANESRHIVAGGESEPRFPRRREDGWWEMEMGRLSAASLEDDVVASFEVLGYYMKRGLLVEAIEFRAVR